MALELTAARPDPALLDLPWRLPLEEWPEDLLAALPRGISRHVVRFVRLSGRVLAVKEIKVDLARREFEMLRNLGRLHLPAVEPFAVVSGRTDSEGRPLDACLVTRHLQFSLPYRALYSQSLRKGTATRLIDALAVLLVRLHLAGFWWGDVSLSNTLFRRDAGAFAAYLVDAETGELRDRVEISERIVTRYRELWDELTGSETIDDSERWRVDDRVRRLNALGFDVDELEIITDIDGASIHLQPKVVDSGHHSRRLLRLTGLDVRENQARRLLNDLGVYAAAHDRQGDDEEIVAHDWLANVYEPVTRQIPRQLLRKLEPAEVFHEVLEHRWYLAERAQHDIPLEAALADYLAKVLPAKPDEVAVLGVDTEELPVIAGDD
jgi:hypothetical protein